MSAPDHELRQRTVSSLLWQSMGVGGQRVVQLAAPIALARLIPRSDIGLFGIVLAGIGAVEALTKFMGEETTIWSKRSGEARYLDTVFTVHLLRGLVITAVLCALATPLAHFFSSPTTEERYWLPGLFLMLAGNGLVEGLTSPARALKLKGMAFRRVATGDFFAVLFGSSLTILLAYLWRDVWAMLVGHLGMTAMRTVISYIVAPYRPRLHIDRSIFRELFQYGRGAAGTPFLLLMVFTAPAFVLAKAIGTGAVAIYDFAGKLAKLPEDIFLRVLAPVAVPAYAQLRSDNARLGRAWLQAVRAFLLIGTPMTLAMAWCGNAVPAFVFGTEYGSISGLFAWQALHGGIAGLVSVVGPLFWAVGKPQLDRSAQFFRCVAMYGLGIPAALWFGVTGFAAATCIAITIALVLSVTFALRYLDLKLTQFLSAMRDGLLVGAGLAAVLLVIDMTVAPEGLLRIVAAAGTGGPVLAFLVFRMLRNRKQQLPPDGPPESPVATPVEEYPADVSL